MSVKRSNLEKVERERPGVCREKSNLGGKEQKAREEEERLENEVQALRAAGSR